MLCQVRYRNESVSSEEGTPMTNIRCPHCGSPVRLRGTRWECTWCGDFGSLASLSPAQRAKLLHPVQALDCPAAEDLDAGQTRDSLQPTPDYASLEDAVRRWNFSQEEWACRDLLLAAFPDTACRFSPEARAGMDTMDLLLSVAETAPDTAIAMMELLLNTAEDHLQQEDTARQILGWDCYDLLLREEIQHRLVAKLGRNDRLARQLFQSAYVGLPQEDLIRACTRLGQPELQQKLLALLEENPHSHDPVPPD